MLKIEKHKEKMRMRWNCRHEASEQQWLKQIKWKEEKKQQMQKEMFGMSEQKNKKRFFTRTLCIHFKFQVVWLDSYDP